MSLQKSERNIQTRRQLFDFLQGQMQTTYTDLKEDQRFSYESSLIKSYIFEVNAPESLNGNSEEWLRHRFGLGDHKRYKVDLIPTDEEAFHQLQVKVDSRELRLYIDAATDSRFWLAYSISESQQLDRWLENVIHKSVDLDFVWLWPNFLHRVQKTGYFRGFGLDYDYRKFENADAEVTTYLKMQLWGGEETEKIYDLLREQDNFRNKVVLSKVRFKQMSGAGQDPDKFAIQDMKYNGKFTARGTDLDTHLITLNKVRNQYRQQIMDIENQCALKWVSNKSGSAHLEGYAINFLPPENFPIPVSLLVEKLFDGTEPFRLMGIPNDINDHSAIMEVVDLHTGGELTMEIYPDVITVYLPEHTCGNTLARFYTNIQHKFNVGFRVETDNGNQLFA